MLPKRSRLTREGFSTAFKGGRRLRVPGAQIVYTPTPHFSAAVVVSKKVSGTAVGRNALRRTVYALISEAKQAHSLSGTFIFILTPEAAALAKTDLTAHIVSGMRDLLSRGGHSR